MSINSEMTALAEAIRSKSGVTEKLSISGMTAAVNLISVGGGSVDLSFVTAEAKDIVKGKVGADKDGNPVYGAFEDRKLIQVTKYTPASQGFFGNARIVVSNCDEVPSINGTYEVTSDTERVADPFARVYMHSSGEWVIWGEYDPEYEEGYWHISPDRNSQKFTCWSSEQLYTGNYEFEDYDEGTLIAVALTCSLESYPETEMLITGINFYAPEQTLYAYAFDVMPQVGRVYNTDGGLIGKPIDAGNGIMPEKLNLLTHWGRLKNGDRKFVDETGNCELRQLGSTDLHLETSQADSPFGNPLLFFNYFNSNEGAVSIRNLPKTSSFTIEFWALIPEERSDYWGGTILANKTYWENTGNYTDSVMISASTDYTNAIYKQWYHHAFVCWLAPDNSPAKQDCAVKEYINGQLVNTYSHIGYPFYDTKTEDVTHDVFLGGNSNEILFVPGGRDGQSSNKYVAQLAIWGRKLSEIDLAAIAQYKQPYYL